MSFELFLARRYLRGDKHTLGGGLTSVIAVSGVVVGVAAMVVALSITTGFQKDIREKILGAQPHLLVMGSGGRLPARDWSPVMEEVPGVLAWTPYVMGQALIKKGPVTQGIVVKGVDPAREAKVTSLDKRVKGGKWNALAAEAQDENVPILLGKELALALHAEPGDAVFVAAPNAGLNPMANLPALYPFTVAGILETGLYDYDLSLAVMPLAAAQQIFQMDDDVSGLGVRLTDVDEPTGPAMLLQQRLGSAASVRSWLMLNRNIFAALKLQKILMFLVVTLITLVAAFTIVSNLLLVTAQKTREIGILRAMGATRTSVQKIFIFKGLLMGGLGVAGGLATGLILSLLLDRTKIVKLPEDVYYVDSLPVDIVATDLGIVAAAAFLIVLLATLYPARLAAKLDALTAIRQG